MKLYLVEQTRYHDEEQLMPYTIQFFTDRAPIDPDIDSEGAKKENLLLCKEFDNVSEDLANFLIKDSDVSLLVPRDYPIPEKVDFIIPVEPWEREDREQIQKVLGNICKIDTTDQAMIPSTEPLSHPGVFITELD